MHQCWVCAYLLCCQGRRRQGHRHQDCHNQYPFRLHHFHPRHRQCLQRHYYLHNSSYRYHDFKIFFHHILCCPIVFRQKFQTESCQHFSCLLVYSLTFIAHVIFEIRCSETIVFHQTLHDETSQYQNIRSHFKINTQNISCNSHIRYILSIARRSNFIF